jgi:hypothetical protein
MRPLDLCVLTPRKRINVYRASDRSLCDGRRVSYTWDVVGSGFKGGGTGLRPRSTCWTTSMTFCWDFYWSSFFEEVIGVVVK